MTEQDLAVADSYFVIDMPVSLSSSEVVIGARSTFCFRGGKLVNDTTGTITLKGDNITIEAGPVQIFDGSFDFKAETSNQPAAWTMERAYPQWFGAKDCSPEVSQAWDLIKIGNISGGKAILDTIDDASAAINAAIKLKRRGEVMIPRGYYRLTHSVNIMPGIALRGEGCVGQRDEVSGTILFPWISSQTGQPEQSEQSGYKALIKNKDTTKQRQEENLSMFDFPLPPRDVKWFRDNNYSPTARIGFMLTACIGDTCSLIYSKVGEDSEHNPIYSDYPERIEYSLATGNRTVGTEISKLALFDLMSLGNGVGGEYDHATLRGILIAGGVRISDVRVYGLSQFVSSTDSEYEDLHFIEHCFFTGPVMLKTDPDGTDGTENVEDLEEILERLYPEKIYAYELSGAGDGLVFQGNHKSQYSGRICALHLKSCNGGSITGNILNSDVLIERSDGIDFAGNHMEYGSRLSIASSAVAVRGNFIWRGEKAAITIRRFDSGGYLYYHSSVTLDNNQLFWRSQHYNTKDAEADPPQAAHFLFPYDVVTDGYASISVNNTFRQCRRNSSGEQSYFGIRMGWLEMKGLQSNSNYLDEEQAYTYEGDDPRNVVGTDYARIYDFEEFNRISHIAGIGSKVAGRRVTPMPFTIDKAAFDYHRDGADEMCMRIGSRNVTYENKDGWKIPADIANNAYQDYCAWLFADYRRRILMQGPVSLSNYYYAAQPGKNQRRITDAKQNLWLAIGQGNITNWNVPAGPYWLYIERQSYTEQPIQSGDPQVDYARSTLSMHRALLPVGNATMLWDDGLILSGYDWELMQGEEGFTSPEVNDTVERVQYHGENVECLFSEAPSIVDGQPQLAGEWLDGDVIKWVGSGGSMAVYCKSDGSWHKCQ